MNFDFRKKNWIVVCKWVLYNKVEKEIDRMQEKVYNMALMGGREWRKKVFMLLNRGVQ